VEIFLFRNDKKINIFVSKQIGMKIFNKAVYNIYKFFLQLFCDHKWKYIQGSILAKDKVIRFTEKKFFKSKNKFVKTNWKQKAKAKVFQCTRCEKIEVRRRSIWHI